MGEEIQWDPEAIDYIRSRYDRYPAAEGIEPEWTQEVMADVDLLALEPDPKSRMGASRFIGHSPSAERVIVRSPTATSTVTSTASTPGRPPALT